MSVYHCFHCNQTNALFQCSVCATKFCGNQCFKIGHRVCFVGMKRGRSDNDDVDLTKMTSIELYELLEEKLGSARDACVLLNPNDPDQVRQSLQVLGVALVPTRVNAVKITGNHMADTFVKLSDTTKEALRRGDFELFSKDLLKSGTAEKFGITSKTSGMINRVPVQTKDYPAFKCNFTETVHVPNTVNAQNNIDVWMSLIGENDNLSPGKWFAPPLRDALHRYQVSEDGIKIMVKKDYNPTGLHYDGQLGESVEDGKAQRVQIVYCDDTGPVRLFAVPGSHTQLVREIIQKITGLKGKPEFATHKETFRKHPQLSEVLLKYGIALPQAGLLMFVANVWHYEGVEGTKPNDMMPINVNPKRHGEAGSLTRKSNVFRIYMGVVSVPIRYLKDMIVFAFLREQGWCMDPFANVNKKHPLFVNEKGMQDGKAWGAGFKADTPEANAFDVLHKTPYEKMVFFLAERFQKNPQRAELYGLKLTDLGPIFKNVTEVE